MNISFIIGIMVLFVCGFYFIAIGISGMIADRVSENLESKFVRK